jgi:hypothetical protein
VSVFEFEDDGLKKRHRLRCGECGEWRARSLGMVRSFALEWGVRRDLRRMARSLSDLEAPEPAARERSRS